MIITILSPGPLAILDVGDIPMAADDDEALPPVVHMCPECDKTFTTARGLHGHRRQAHQVLPVHTYLLRGRKCPSCNAAYSTRAQALNHLHGRKACLGWAVDHVTPLSHEEYLLEMKEEKRQLKQHYRLAAPMVGPSGGCGEDGRPIARLVEAFDPAILQPELP
eukprot:6021112-Amphidinium_carterae.1